MMRNMNGKKYGVIFALILIMSMMLCLSAQAEVYVWTDTTNIQDYEVGDYLELFTPFNGAENYLVRYYGSDRTTEIGTHKNGASGMLNMPDLKYRQWSSYKDTQIWQVFAKKAFLNGYSVCVAPAEIRSDLTYDDLAEGMLLAAGSIVHAKSDYGIRYYDGSKKLAESTLGSDAVIGQPQEIYFDWALEESTYQNCGFWYIFKVENTGTSVWYRVKPVDITLMPTPSPVPPTPAPTPAPTPKPDYKIIRGGNQTADKKVIRNTQDGVRFDSDAPFEKFVRVELDGKTLSPDMYTAASGSTVIKLLPKLIETLDPGRHILKIVSSDGSAETEFTITDLPLTGDTKPVALYAILALCIIAASAVSIRKKNNA